MDLSGYILVSRNNVIYRANLSCLSDLLVANDTKEKFLEKLDNILASVDALTSSFDLQLESKSGLQSDFASKDNVASLTADGKYTLSSDAVSTISTVMSKAELSSNSSSCWYQVQSRRSVQDVIEGYTSSIGILKNKTPATAATDYGVTPTYDVIMSTYKDLDL